MKRSRVPQAWQRDPNQIDTSKVQFWANGVMASCNIMREDAQKMVTKGIAFVISGQAIGAIINGEMAS